MVHSLRDRYRRDLIYTWVGANHSVLVSINPFKMLPIYSPATIEEYAKPSAYRLDPPHTFAIANSAFMKLTQENTSQVGWGCSVFWLHLCTAEPAGWWRSTVVHSLVYSPSR